MQFAMTRLLACVALTKIVVDWFVDFRRYAHPPNTITLSCAALSMPTSRRRGSRRDERRRGWSELRLA
jgi:hypothetical protein